MLTYDIKIILERPKMDKKSLYLYCDVWPRDSCYYPENYFRWFPEGFYNKRRQPPLLNVCSKKLIYDIKCVGCKIKKKLLTSHIVETFWLSSEIVFWII